MIASVPVRLLSLAIVAAVAIVGVRVVVGGFAIGRGPAGSTVEVRAEAGDRVTGVVAYVVDGDTVQVTADGGPEARVRLLGISAPEIPHPGQSGECYAIPSTRHLKRLLPAGTQVTLQRDPSQHSIDTYGRWLRYVEKDARDVGRTQIRSGSATARASSGPVSRSTTYERAEALARSSDLGIWAECR